jgi:hypothetical protein
MNRRYITLNSNLKTEGLESNARHPEKQLKWKIIPRTTQHYVELILTLDFF